MAPSDYPQTEPPLSLYQIIIPSLCPIVRIVTVHNRFLVYVFGCKDRDKYALTKHEETRFCKERNRPQPVDSCVYVGAMIENKQDTDRK